MKKFIMFSAGFTVAFISGLVAGASAIIYVVDDKRSDAEQYKMYSRLDHD